MVVVMEVVGTRYPEAEHTRKKRGQYRYRTTWVVPGDVIQW